MNQNLITELAEIIHRHTPDEGIFDTPTPGLQIFKATTTNVPTPSIYNPSLCLLVQGKKQVMLDKDIYEYSVSQFLIISVDLPITGIVTEASKDKPYLSLKIDIEKAMLSELLIDIDYPASKITKTGYGLNVAEADQTVGESVLHLVKMLDSPEDFPVLATQSTREILYRVLRGQYGHQLAQTAFKGSHIEKISNAIRKIRTHFNSTITVDELAEIAGMSVSGFHSHFKTVTSMSPLKFQKQLRLTEARNLMLSQSLDAASAAYRVGYESPSQFNREYARMFGNPPVRDVSMLKSANQSELIVNK